MQRRYLAAPILISTESARQISRDGALARWLDSPKRPSQQGCNRHEGAPDDVLSNNGQTISMLHSTVPGQPPVSGINRCRAADSPGISRASERYRLADRQMPYVRIDFLLACLRSLKRLGHELWKSFSDWREISLRAQLGSVIIGDEPKMHGRDASALIFSDQEI